MTLRSFDLATDYSAVTSVVNAAYPAYPFTPESLRHRDEREPEHCLRARWVAEVGGETVGVGGYEQRSDMYAPGRFELRLYVTPERQCEGIGRALYATVLSALEKLSPTELRTFCQETEPRALRFFAERGFSETMRDGQAYLDLSAFDSESWPTDLPEGVTIASYEALQNRPGFVEELCALHNAIMADVPPLGVRSPVSADDFARRFLDPHDKRLDGSFAAVGPGGSLIGVSELRNAQDGARKTLWIGLTGVRRDGRGKGVALALKLAAMRWARARGYESLRTGNASDNVPILTLNERLGFVREPWRVQLARPA